MLGTSLAQFFPQGDLTVVSPTGRSQQFGDGTGPPIVIRLRDWRTVMKIAWNPKLYIGEAYMDGALVFVTGDLSDFFALYMRNAEVSDQVAPGVWARAMSWLKRRMVMPNGSRRSRQNVAHHYDLSVDLYRQFLDSQMYYSCAYFEDAGMSLEDAQAAKARHIGAKLLLSPGKRVLDIGSGWGGLALALAKAGDVTVKGLTLSTEQLSEARQRASLAGLGERVTFDLTDYREETAVFDRIVSVGMFEHVGPSAFDEFFRTIRDRLAPDGVALIHSIGRKGPPGQTNPWISKYIFPGGYVPALSETLAAVERAGLWVTDVEVLRLHYAETCRHWRQRFHQNMDAIRQIFDDRFIRMWDFYLAVSEAGFRSGDLMVFQIQLARRVDAVPLTRGFRDVPAGREQLALAAE